MLFVILCFSLPKYLSTFYLFSIYTLAFFFAFLNVIFVMTIWTKFQFVFSL